MSSGISDNLKRACKLLKVRIANLFRPWFMERQQRSHKPQMFAYQLIGEQATRLLPLFKDLDVNLRKSGIKITFKAYVSTVILTVALLLCIVFLLVFSPLFLIFNLSFFSSLLFAIGGSLFAGALTVISFYAYPIYRADSLKRDIEDDLYFTTGHMSILAGAGVPADFIFRSLAKTDASFPVSNEARNIVRDIDLFGFDILTALDAASQRTPSEQFKELIEGFIATIQSGGSLVTYLGDRSQQYSEFKRIALKRFSDVLAILGEIYVTLMVAGSLILVVMLAVMAMLGGGGSGLLDPRLLLYLLTYIGLPVGSIVFIIFFDSISPKR
jgi:flagellar protein FlaJ